MMKKIFYFLICATLFACTDDNTFTDTPVKPVFMDETVLARCNDFHDINILGNADWEVTEHPIWAVPMKYEGTAGTPLQIFVEMNDEDEDRRDTLSVELANGSTVTIPLRQHGLASSDENSDITINAKTLNQVYGVGFGVDVIEKSGMTGIKYNVKAASPFNFANLQQIIEKKNWDDVIIEEPIYFSRYESVTGSSTDALSNQLGINAGIEVGIKAFKFNVEAGFSSSSSEDSRYSYAMLEIQHIVGSRYFRGGMMRYLAEHIDEMDKLLLVKQKNKFEPNSPSPSLFQTTFNQQVGILKDGNSTAEKIQEALWTLVNRYGTHIITRGTLGGELCVSMQKQEDNSSSGTSIHAALGVSAKVLDAEGNFKVEGNDKIATANTTISLRSYGGTNAFTIAPGTTFEGFMTKLKGGEHKVNKDSANIDQWVEGIRRKDSIMVKGKKESSLALIDMETIPLWDLMPNEKVRTMVRNFIVKDYQESVASNHGGTFTPDLFLVNGYDVTTNFPGCGSVYIPEIDMQIVFERTIIKELDTNELSTVVYSGTKDNVNRDRGFFVGSTTRKPCKFHREKNGKFTTEEFDRLTETAISELYVDVTGDITIAPTGIDDMYVTCSVNNWKHDLSMLTSDWTFEEDVTVTGTTDHCIHIANGTMLTLDNVTVNNQIVCDGNASIVLADGTTNTIAQGIVNGPEGTTLTIGGAGLLKATGKSDYPGIGNGKGNIVIKGGTVKAEGGDSAAGIGAGKNGHCGTIIIAQGTKEVAAACGKGEDCEPIGVGDGDSSCGDVSIHSTVSVSENDPNAFYLGGVISTVNINKNCTITGSTIFNVIVAPGVRVTLAGVNLENQLICQGANEIRLRQRTYNRVNSGVVAGNQGLTISGKGILSANGKTNSPGIDGMHGDIIIKDGHISATGGEGAAGIGGGSNNGCRNIIISGGTVTSKGGNNAAGIGAGYIGNCGAINISGGSVTGTTSLDAEKCAGIGSGTYGFVESINISGGTVSGSTSSYYSTGIGGSCGSINISGGTVSGTATSPYSTGIGGSCGNINILGGDVSGNSSYYGPGIGYYSVDNVRFGNILISGGIVNAHGGKFAAGIGSGYSCNCGKITIKNTIERVVARKGSEASDAIGRGKDGFCDTVTIEEGANVIQE